MLGIPERSALPRCVRSIQWIRSDRWVVAGSWGLPVRWVSRSGGGDKHADESPSQRRGPRALVSILVSPIGATANNQPSRKVKRDRPRSPCRPASSAVRPVVIAEVLEGTTGGPIPAAIVGVSASATERHGSRIDPGRVSPRLRLAAACATPTRPGPDDRRPPSCPSRVGNRDRAHVHLDSTPRAASGATVKLNIIPLSWCSAM